MAKNCIKCVLNEQSENKRDGLCDACRAAPHSVIFFASGGAEVRNFLRMPIEKYKGTHKQVIDALAADKIDWKTIPDRQGVPQLPKPAPEHK